MVGFPNKNMLKNIALLGCPRVSRHINHYVSLAMGEPTTLPMRALLSPHSLVSTGSTQFGYGLLGLPTTRARDTGFVSAFPLLGKAMLSSFDTILSQILFSIHTLYYNIDFNNMQALAFIYSDEGTNFINIQPYYGD